jgi:hypothetical protein
VTLKAEISFALTPTGDSDEDTPSFGAKIEGNGGFELAARGAHNLAPSTPAPSSDGAEVEPGCTPGDCVQSKADLTFTAEICADLVAFNIFQFCAGYRYNFRECRSKTLYAKDPEVCGTDQWCGASGTVSANSGEFIGGGVTSGTCGCSGPGKLEEIE